MSEEKELRGTNIQTNKDWKYFITGEKHDVYIDIFLLYQDWNGQIQINSHIDLVSWKDRTPSSNKTS